MDWLLLLFRHELLVFALVLARVGGLVLSGPVLSSRVVPVRLRIALAVCLAAVISPVHWQNSIQQPLHPTQFIIAAAGEILLGLLFGGALALCLAAARQAGQMASQLIGLSFAQTEDEQADGAAALARLLDLVAVGIFLTIGGHRQMVAALLDTFQWLPPGAAVPSPVWLEGLLAVVTQSAALGLRIAAPWIVSLLLAHLGMGFLSRTVPQFSAMGLGFSVNVLVALGVLSLSLGTVLWVFQDDLERAIATVQAAVSRLAPAGLAPVGLLPPAGASNV